MKWKKFLIKYFKSPILWGLFCVLNFRLVKVAVVKIKRYINLCLNVVYYKYMKIIKCIIIKAISINSN